MFCFFAFSLFVADRFRKDLHHGHWLWRKHLGGRAGHHPTGRATSLPGHPETQTRCTERRHAPARIQSQRPVPGGETSSNIEPLFFGSVAAIYRVQWNQFSFFPNCFFFFFTKSSFFFPSLIFWILFFSPVRIVLHSVLEVKLHFSNQEVCVTLLHIVWVTN